MKLRNALLSIVLGIVVTGCWKQHDTLTISKDGTIRFVTKTEITDKSLGFKDVDQLSNEFVQGLEKRGWEVEKSWIKKEYPFEMKFTGKGNVKEVGEYSDFYRIVKVSDSEFKIRFIPAESRKGKSSRSVVLSSASLPLYSAEGSKVTAIDNVSGSTEYVIKL